MSGYRIPAGHRWRLALSPTYARHAWPSPEAATLSLFTGAASRLRLPVRTPQPEDGALAPFEPVETAAPLAVEVQRTGSRRQVIQRDLVNGLTELKVIIDSGRLRLNDHALELDDVGLETFTILDDEPLSAVQRVQYRLEYKRDEWQVRLETDSTMTAAVAHFHVTNRLDAYEGDTRVYSKASTFTVPRDLV
jgi:hypothetical protein